MNYRFKLSRRLALVHTGAVLAAALAFSGCGDAKIAAPGFASDSTIISASRVKSVTLSPVLDTLVIGAKQQFTATPRDIKGNVLSVSAMTWSSSDTTVLSVSSGGLAIGLKAGQAAVVVTTSGIRDSARVLVKDTTTAQTRDTTVVTSLTLSPTADTLTVGATQQFAAAGRNVNGTALAGAQIAWKSSDSTIVAVSASGLATGRKAGQALLVAATGTLADTARVLVNAVVVQQPLPSDTNHVGWMVTPTGTASGDGTRAAPFDLNTALQGANGKIQPGDTVWLRGGTYTGFFVSYVSGAQGKPIIFRQWPGERATIDGYLRANGSDVWFWGFEIMRSNPTAGDKLPGFESRGARQHIINLVIHDAAQQGITFWDEAIDAEVYGCLVYNNGTHDNLDHGIYVHNYTGTKLISDNVFFDNLAYGIHVYAGPTDLPQVNVHVIGNVSFDNGTIDAATGPRSDIIVGAEVPDAGMQVKDNMLYYVGSAGKGIWAGYTASNQDITITGNYMAGGATGLYVGAPWSSATVANNTVAGSGSMVEFHDSPSAYSWSTNKYFRDATASAWLNYSTALSFSGWKSATGLGASDLVPGTSPATTQVFVRPNKYEAGRALVVVYNFGGQGSVAADMTGILQAGQHYVVRNVQDWFGTPIAGGTYQGGTISIPMTGVNPAVPIGRSTPLPPRTGPNFDTFVVMPG